MRPSTCRTTNRMHNERDFIEMYKCSNGWWPNARYICSLEYCGPHHCCVYVPRTTCRQTGRRLIRKMLNQIDTFNSSHFELIRLIRANNFGRVFNCKKIDSHKVKPDAMVTRAIFNIYWIIDAASITCKKCLVLVLKNRRALPRSLFHFDMVTVILGTRYSILYCRSLVFRCLLAEDWTNFGWHKQLNTNYTTLGLTEGIAEIPKM